MPNLKCPLQGVSLLQTDATSPTSLVCQKATRLVTTLSGHSMQRKFHPHGTQEMSKGTEMSAAAKPSWITKRFLTGKVRPMQVDFLFGQSKSVHLLKFCIPHVTNVALHGSEGALREDTQQQILGHLKKSCFGVAENIFAFEDILDWDSVSINSLG